MKRRKNISIVIRESHEARRARLEAERTHNELLLLAHLAYLQAIRPQPPAPQPPEMSSWEKRLIIAQFLLIIPQLLLLIITLLAALAPELVSQMLPGWFLQ